MNIVGALNLEKMSLVYDNFETVNGESIVTFFKKLQRAYPKAPNIHVILDCSGYHQSQFVKTFAERFGIKLHFLPPYSPNLNPIERLWKVMNERVRNNSYFESAKELRREIHRFFQVIFPEIAEELTDRINDNFSPIKPATSF